MNKYKSGLLALCILALSTCTNGKNELTADNIIGNAIEAYGGESALKGITSKITQGTTLIYLNDSLFRSTPYLSYQKSPAKSYYVSPPGGEAYQERLIFASNGSSSWTQNDGALHPYPQPQAEHTNTKGEDFPYLFTLKERGINMQYMETIREEGLTLHRVDYKQAHSTEEVYFNATNWLIFKTRRFIETSQGGAELIKHFRDYRDVSGTQVPFRIESFFPPRELNVHLINKMEINTEVDDEIFEFPEAPDVDTSTLDRFTGNYRLSQDASIRIFREGERLYVSTQNQPKISAQVVSEDFLMYRDGEGNGSRMANVFLKTDQNNRLYLNHQLRKKTLRAYKE